MLIKKKNKMPLIKFIVLLLTIVIVISLTIKFSPYLIDLLKHPSDIRDYMLSIGTLGKILFFLTLVAHVIVVIFPGDVLYVLGGYTFGLSTGFLLSYFGILTGGFIVFNFSRFLGYDFVKKIVSKDKLEKADKLLNSVKGLFGLFILCLIPIYPKSTIMYAAGLTPIKTIKLFSVYALSRIPVILMWAAVGAKAYDKDYSQMFIVIGLLVLFGLISIFLRKKIFSKSK